MRILKFGGASLASPIQLKQIALKLAQFHQRGEQLIVVVSAMGSTTNDLINLALEINPTPPSRELDMLLSTGERVAMSLMSMALKHHGCEAISFTGSQAGILTDNRHSDARIKTLTPNRVAEQLALGKIVVLAGFQGVCPETKEITTLGRGGSDTTAVALAAHFKAEACEIRKEVQGFFSIDPKRSLNSKHYPRISSHHLLQATFWGAKLLHPRSAALAQKFKVPLLIGSTDFISEPTRVFYKEDNMLEEENFVSIHQLEPVALIDWPIDSPLEALKKIEDLFKSNQLPSPRILYSQKTEMPRGLKLLLLFETHLFSQSIELLEQAGSQAQSDLTVISLIGHTGRAHEVLAKSFDLLSGLGIEPLLTFSNPNQIQLVVASSSSEEASKRLHDFWINQL